MPYGLYLSAEGAQAQSQRMEVISHNLANVDTPGFKRDLALFQARYAEAIEQGLDFPGSGSINDTGGGIVLRATATDFSGGPLKRTSIPTDMALPGEGFFLVRKDEEELLTRAGNFRLTNDGSLVTQQGDPVLDEAGTPIAIDPELGPWRLAQDGVIEQAGTLVPLAIVRPESLGQLTKVGENFFRATGDVSPLAPSERRVAGGFVEGSGVSPTLEMMQLIEASRAFEANVALIRHQDQMLAGITGRVLRA